MTSQSGLSENLVATRPKKRKKFIANKNKKAEQSNSTYHLFAISVVSFLLFYLCIQGFVDNGFLLRTELNALQDASGMDSGALEGSGNLFNRLFWPAILALCAPFFWFERNRVARRLADHKMLAVLLLFCLASAVWSIDPGISLRRWTRLVLTLTILIGLTALLRRDDRLLLAGELAALGVIALNLWAVFAKPDLVFSENQLLLGVHHNKNSAGQAAAFVALFFLFSAQRDARLLGRLARLGLAALALWALWLTGSRTALLATCGGALCGFGLSVASARGAMSLLFAYFCLLVALVLAFLAIDAGAGSDLAVRVEEDRVVEDTTLSGRTEMWRDLFRLYLQTPIVGYGYGGFWNVGSDGPQMRGIELVQIMGQGHNGYLDILLALGGLGALFALAWLAHPFWRALAISGAKKHVSPLLFGLLAAALIHNLAESSFLRSSHLFFALLILAQSQLLAMARASASPAKPRGARPSRSKSSSRRSASRTRRRLD